MSKFAVTSLKSPIIRSYNLTVLFTYVSVFVLALMAALYAFDIQKDEILQKREQQVANNIKQIDLLLETEMLSLQSMKKLALDELGQRELIRARNIREFLQFNQNRPDSFLMYHKENHNGEVFKRMGRISGTGEFENRSKAFYQELDMLLELSLSFAFAKETLKRAGAIYYLSRNNLLSYYPWQENGPTFVPSMLKEPFFTLATPEQNPQRTIFWTQAYLDSESNTLVSTIGNPVYSNNQFLGSINIDIDLHKLAQDIQESFKLNGQVILLDQANNVLSHSEYMSEPSAKVYHLSQRIPPAIHELSKPDFLQKYSGKVYKNYYIQSVELQNAPWRVLFIQDDKELFDDLWIRLQLSFLLVIVILSLLVTAVHYLTSRTFISPASKLLDYIQDCAVEPKSPPKSVLTEWRPWFSLVYRIFTENRQYTITLTEQNQQLDKLVAQRTQTLNDINARRERDYALLRSLLDSIPEAIAFKDIEGRFLGCNKSAEKLLGFKEHELIGKFEIDLVGEQRRDEIHREKQVILTEKEIHYQEAIELMGQTIHLDTNKLPFYHRNGEILGLICVWRDITAQFDAAERLKASEQRYELAMNAVEDGLWDWYLDSEQLICNHAFYSMLGYDFEEFSPLVSHFKKLIHQDDLQRYMHYTNTYLLSPDGAYELEFRMRAKNGDYHWILSRGAVVEYSSSGAPIRMVGTHKDITKQKRSEVALIEAKHEAEMANIYKSEFLANMSHEIRTPMNAILGMMQLVQNTELTTQQQDYISKANFSAQNLLRIINDILDFSKVEAGMLDMEQINFNLDKVLEHVVEVNVLLAEKKGVELSLFANYPPELILVGDGLRLGQILINLISNAVKFTNEGEVEVGCEEIDNHHGEIVLQFWVKDTGIGIEQDKQAMLFDPFAQADGSITREFGGTGLGLSICNHLVSMMGGAIELDSEIGKGSTFSFELTFKIGEASQLTEIDLSQFDTKKELQDKRQLGASTLDMEKPHLLLAEDNIINQQVAKELLQSAGYEVTLADNGQQAIDKLADDDFAAILMDIQMPVLDGLSAAKAIRSGEVKADIPIIAMTAHAMEGDRQKSLQAGMNDHVTKPINLPELIAALNRLIKPN